MTKAFSPMTPPPKAGFSGEIDPALLMQHTSSKRKKSHKTAASNRDKIALTVLEDFFAPPSIAVSSDAATVEEVVDEDEQDYYNHHNNHILSGGGGGGGDCSSKGTQSLATTVSTMTMTRASTHANLALGGGSGNRRRSSPADNSAGGLRGALSKLALCSQSAREESLDLSFLVSQLRQAVSAQQAADCLQRMALLLKDCCTSETRMSTQELQSEFIAEGADHSIISSLWTFHSNVHVQFYGIIVMGELAKNHNLTNQKILVLKGGIEVVLTAMKAHSMSEALQEEACRCLKNLMKYFDTAKDQVARHKGISRILQAMMTHPEYGSLQRQACYALTSLACLKNISDEIVAKQGHNIIYKTMQSHNDDPYVLAEAWRTLTNIVIHAMDIALDEKLAAKGCIEDVCQALQKFSDCTLVPIQARGLALLTHLCYRSDRNLALVTSEPEHLEIIHRTLRIWRYDEQVQTAGEKLVQRIASAEYPTDTQQHHRQHASGSKSTSSKEHFSVSSSIKRKHNVVGQITNHRGVDIIVDTTNCY